MTWHAPEDDQVPAWTPELTVLKDADGLDRVRLGPSGFDSSYLRTAEAGRLVDYAGELYRQAPHATSWQEVARVRATWSPVRQRAGDALAIARKLCACACQSSLATGSRPLFLSTTHTGGPVRGTEGRWVLRAKPQSERSQPGHAQGSVRENH